MINDDKNDNSSNDKDYIIIMKQNILCPISSPRLYELFILFSFALSLQFFFSENNPRNNKYKL